MMPLLRRIHRWVTTLAVILLAYVSVTGFLLGLDSVKIWYDGGYPGAPKPTRRAPGPPGGLVTPLDDPSHARALLAQVLAAAGQDALTTISLRALPGQVVGVTTDVHGITHAYDTASGAPADPALGADVPPLLNANMTRHQLLKDLNNGNILGLTGRGFDILTGLALLTVCLSGLGMYAQIYWSRLKLGRPSPFWR